MLIAVERVAPEVSANVVVAAKISTHEVMTTQARLAEKRPNL